MLMLCSDIIIIKIGELLTDRQKIRLTMTSKSMNLLKHIFVYQKKIDITKIRNLSYFNNFECVEISNARYKRMPQKIKCVYFKASKRNIPLFVTHLTFDDEFDKSIDGCIPASVTHLKFGRLFNRQINNCIPSSVIHLTFGMWFNQPIKNCIPQSVTHLIFGTRFDQPISNNIPSSVTHIKFGSFFDQSINDISHQQ